MGELMKKSGIVLLMMFIVSQVMFGSARMGSLGEYFTFIVSDIDTDVEMFPTHLEDYESKHIQLFTYVNEPDRYSSTDKINLAILPLLKRFSYKLFLGVDGNEENDFFQNYHLDEKIDQKYYYYPYSSYRGRRISTDGFEAATMKNLFSFKISENFSLGSVISITKEINDSYQDADSEDTNSEQTFLMDQEISLDDFSALLNLSIKNFFLNEISLSYRHFEYFEDYYRTQTEYYSNNFDNYRVLERTDFSDSDETGKTYKVVLLHEKKEDKKIKRLYSEFSYSEYDLSYYDSDYEMRKDYNDNELDDTDLMKEVLKSSYENTHYEGCLGWGNEYKKKKLTTFYGLKLSGFLGEFTGTKDFSSLEIHEEIFQDSIVTDSLFTEDDYLIGGKEYRASVELPFGAKFKVNKKINIYGGLGYKVTRLYLQNDYSENFYRWHTETYSSLGAEYNPIKELMLNICFNGSLTSIKHWVVDMKYLF